MWKIILIAVSLSMDAFSLSLSYGTNGIKEHDIRKIAITVGIFHFFMPLFGLLMGSTLLFFIKINTDILVFVILTFIGIEMLVESFKEREEIHLISLVELLLFALAVSLDSLSVGIGLKAITNQYITSSIIFALTSFMFTFTGLKIGKYANLKLGTIATIIGGIILIILGLLYIL